jgi:hypothetical protein
VSSLDTRLLVAVLSRTGWRMARKLVRTGRVRRRASRAHDRFAIAAVAVDHHLPERAALAVVAREPS